MAKLLVFLGFSIFITLNLQAQKRSDWMLMQSNTVSVTNAYENRPFLISSNTPKNIKYNPIAYIAGGCMYFYQQVVSPQFSASCLYHPTCSEYSKALISEFGVFKGIVCTSDRLTRCNRISAVGNRFIEKDGSGKIPESPTYYKW